MGIRNVKVKALKKTPPFRKVAIGTWGKPTDPQIYGTIDIDLTKAQAWRKKLPPDGPKVTVTHMIAKAIGLAMKKYPDLNGFLRFRKIYLRPTVDMTVSPVVTTFISMKNARISALPFYCHPIPLIRVINFIVIL